MNDKAVDEEQHELKKQFVEMLYTVVRDHANQLLTNVRKLRMDIPVDTEPTYETIQELIDEVCPIIMALADHIQDPMIGMKSTELCLLMRKIVVAIQNENEDDLHKFYEELNKGSLL